MKWRLPVVGLRSRLVLIGLLGIIPGLVAIRYLGRDPLILLVTIGSIAFVAVAAHLFVLRQAKVFKAERELRKSEDRYRTLFNQNPYPMWVYDRETLAFLEVNQSAVTKYGYTRAEFLAMTILDIRPTSEAKVVESLVSVERDEWTLIGPWHHRLKSGDLIDVELSSHAFTFEGRSARLVAVRDVTDRERAATELRVAEEKLRQSQRLEAVGLLAGGIAHDFNNLLMVIEGNTDFAIRSLDRDSRARKDLLEVRQAAARAAKLTAQLLAFSRKQTLRPETIDIDQLVGDLAPMVHRLIGEDIEVRCELHGQGALTVADRNQLEQAVLNLALNSRDAMPSGGILCITTGASHVTRDDLAGRHPELEPGHYVTIVVKDSGCGMDHQTLARAFEPFFTTKRVGKGTGLGLSSVYGTVKQSGGHIAAESAVGIGTAMTIYLPRVMDAETPVLEDRTSGSSSASAGAETILLVEDDRAVRELIARTLNAAGYRVIAADSGAEAIERSERHPGKIDLVLSDVVMPGVPVTTMLDVVRARRASMAVLLMSGYPDVEIARRGMWLDRYEILEKPVTAERLLGAVTRVLQEGLNTNDDLRLNTAAGAVA